MKNKTTNNVMDAVMNSIVSRYGVPEIVITDLGQEFNSVDFKTMLSDLVFSTGARLGTTRSQMVGSKDFTAHLNRFLQN